MTKEQKEIMANIVDKQFQKFVINTEPISSEHYKELKHRLEMVLLELLYLSCNKYFLRLLK